MTSLTDTSSRDELWLCLGHHKCASTTLHKLFDELCGRCGRHVGYVGNLYPDSLHEHVRTQNYQALSLGNADPQRLAELPAFKGFHLIRDPRDIVVSAYYSHRYSHSTEDWEDMQRHRERLNSVPQKEGLLLELDFWPTKITLERMSQWDYTNPHILECRFEDFTADIEGWIRRLCAFWGITISARPAMGENLRLSWNRRSWQRRGLRRLRLPTGALAETDVREMAEGLSFKKLASGRRRGEENQSSHYRSGKPGQWRELFDDELKQAFLDRFPNIFSSTGYPPFD